MSAPVIQQNAPATKQGEYAPGKPVRQVSVWRRALLAISEMNYASRRLVEVQAPWAFGAHRRSM
jgi:hypothetical protein